MTDNPTVASSTHIAASAETVYGLVSDLTRMGEWSPEATGGEWVGGPGPAVGVKFKGTNAHGAKSWKTVVKVTDASAPSRFAFSNGLGPLVVAEWIYEIAPVADGCELTESWIDRRGPIIGFIGKHLTGVDDRIAHTRSMIEKTLAGIKATAEGAR
ncbi:MAG TPA: SRPBCC family protein [Pseudonocardia sp.]|jgi:hypothetical protein